jgi:hypothetical protein
VAGRRTHLLLAALMWTVVGLGLTVVGGRWLMQVDGSLRWTGVALAIVIGVAKGVFVLRRTARRNVRRIMDRGDGCCLGGFVSWKMWLFILAMMAGGRLLRGSDLPLWILGTIYAGIGLALASSSATIWSALRGYDARAENWPAAPNDQPLADD